MNWYCCSSWFTLLWLQRRLSLQGCSKSINLARFNTGEHGWKHLELWRDSIADLACGSVNPNSPLNSAVSRYDSRSWNQICSNWPCFFRWGMGQLLCRWALSQSPPLALYVGVDVGALSLVSISWPGEKGRLWLWTVGSVGWRNLHGDVFQYPYSLVSFFVFTIESIPIISGLFF